MKKLRELLHNILVPNDVLNHRMYLIRQKGTHNFLFIRSVSAQVNEYSVSCNTHSAAPFDGACIYSWEDAKKKIAQIQEQQRKENTPRHLRADLKAVLYQDACREYGIPLIKGVNHMKVVAPDFKESDNEKSQIEM